MLGAFTDTLAQSFKFVLLLLGRASEICDTCFDAHGLFPSHWIGEFCSSSCRTVRCGAVVENCLLQVGTWKAGIKKADLQRCRRAIFGKIGRREKNADRPAGGGRIRLPRIGRGTSAGTDR